MMDTITLQILNPVNPAVPNMVFIINPPTNAPRTPTIIFLPAPIFSLFPVIILAIQPASAPTIIQLTSPILSPTFFIIYLTLLFTVEEIICIYILALSLNTIMHKAKILAYNIFLD